MIANKCFRAWLVASILSNVSVSAFLPASTNYRRQQPLRNAYLESLADSEKTDTRDLSTTAATAAFRAANVGISDAVFVPQSPVASTDDAKQGQPVTVTIGDASSPPAQGSPKIVNATQTPSMNGWSRQREAKSQDSPETRKASYESERQKYDQASFLRNVQVVSTQGNKSEETEDVTVQAAVVEVLPKDPPMLADEGHTEYLAAKNFELEKENSDLLRENERQKFELESFLRDSLSDPLEHHIPTKRAPWDDDSLIEANSRLRSENELQRHDLRAIQSEMNDMESIIQSIEDRSYLESQKLKDMNEQLRDENERQKRQIDAFSLQMTNMQNLLQSIRDEAVSLENEKKKLQNDNDLLTSQLRGSESDSQRNAYELGSRNEQIARLQNVVTTLQNDYSELQNQKDLVAKDKASLESKFDSAVGQYETQRYELEAYKKDRASMESLVHSIREESESLKNNKKELQQALVDMKVMVDDLTQQAVASQNKFNILQAEKDEIVIQNQETQRRLQLQLQDSFSQLKQLSGEKNGMEERLQSLENENSSQRNEIENSSRDKRVLEGMIQSMQKETDALRNEKTALETTLISLQQENQELERQVSVSKDEIERLQSEKDTAIAQSSERYDNYQQLQLRFQEVLDELELCRHGGAHPPANFEYEGVDQDFMSRINSRQQNQMRRNQTNEPRNRSWWN